MSGPLSHAPGPTAAFSGRRRPVVTVVGLGPAGGSLVLPAARELLGTETGAPALFRTGRHPAAAELMNELRATGRDVVSFDSSYEEETSFEAVYASIVGAIVSEAADHGHVIYAVPGSPLVAERTVDLLRALDPTRSPAGAVSTRRESEAGQRLPVPIELRIVPGLSFCDLAWARLGLDPVAAGVRLVDGLSFGWQAAGERGPLLVGQCWSNAVLSEVKLALDEPAEGQHAVILHHLGLPDEIVEDVPWQEIDRTVKADHLTSLFVAELAAPVGCELLKLVETIAALRRLCPWDREQTHQSLIRHLLEETYEVIEAIEGLGDTPETAPAAVVAHAEDELGDLLCQVIFHAGLAREEGLFDLADVARSNHEKLVARHPHVFADVKADTAGAVIRNWELIKEAERPGSGLLDGIPPALPALARAAKVEAKLSSAGLGWPAARDAEPGRDAEQAAGDGLLAMARELAHAGIDPESALRRSLGRLAERVREVEGAAALAGCDLRRLPPDEREVWFREGPPKP